MKRAAAIVAAVMVAGVACAATNAPPDMRRVARIDTPEEAADAFRLAQKTGGEFRAEMPSGQLFVIAWATSLGPGQNMGERPVPWYKRGKVVGSVAGGTALVGTGVAVAANNTDWFGRPHYGKGTEAEQAQAQSQIESHMTADTSGDGEGGDRSVRQWIEVNFNFGGKAGKI